MDCIRVQRGASEFANSETKNKLKCEKLSTDRYKDIARRCPLYEQELNPIPSNECFPSLVSKINNLTSNVTAITSLAGIHLVHTILNFAPCLQNKIIPVINKVSRYIGRCCLV
jgi:hypothetical protein